MKDENGNEIEETGGSGEMQSGLAVFKEDMTWDDHPVTEDGTQIIKTPGTDDAEKEEPVIIDDEKYAPTIQGDRVFRPKHYTQYTMEPFTFLMLNKIPFAEGCIIKYVMRWRQKNGIEDLRKAMRILEMMIEMEANEDLYTPEKGCL